MSEPAEMTPRLEPMRLELEEAARRLKDGDLSNDEAAALVERLAEMAGELGRALDRDASAGETGVSPGQEPLL